jgi:hypothetical protein
MPVNITIQISEEAARWARRKAAEDNTTISRMVGELLERQMSLSDEYWRASSAGSRTVLWRLWEPKRA